MKQDRDTKIGERAKAIVKAKASMEALRKAQAAPKRPMPKEPTTGGSDTVPMTSDRKEFLKEMAKRNATPGMAKGGKMAKKPVKAKDKPFAATKFGAAMVKKSADTKGRAMVKKAMGGMAMPSRMGGQAPAMQSAPMQSAPMPSRMGGQAPAMQSAPMPSRPTPNRNMPVRRAEGGSMETAKGGKATKFGAAMVKKSADTKGRAMVKKAGGGKCYASGGLIAGHKSADGIATKGKTKGKTATMARGGSAKMRGRDSYGGAMLKKGGSC